MVLIPADKLSTFFGYFVGKTASDVQEMIRVMSNQFVEAVLNRSRTDTQELQVSLNKEILERKNAQLHVQLLTFQIQNQTIPPPFSTGGHRCIGCVEVSVRKSGTHWEVLTHFTQTADVHCRKTLEMSVQCLKREPMEHRVVTLYGGIDVVQCRGRLREFLSPSSVSGARFTTETRERAVQGIVEEWVTNVHGRFLAHLLYPLTDSDTIRVHKNDYIMPVATEEDIEFMHRLGTVGEDGTMTL